MGTKVSNTKERAKSEDLSRQNGTNSTVTQTKLQPLLDKHVVKHLVQSNHVQAKLTIGEPDDIYEQEADRIADKMMRMPETHNLENKHSELTPIHGISGRCLFMKSHGEIVHDVISAKETNTPGLSGVETTLRESGHLLDNHTRAFFEPRFSADFSSVKIHTGSQAAASANAINARAYTVGQHIVFNSGQYSPHSEKGKSLVAHELTHVMQQRSGDVKMKIQRDCSDPDFCTPYTTATEIADAKAYLLDDFVPALEQYLGSDVGALWRRYLSRKPGASLAPVIFNTPGNSIHDSFSDNEYIYDETDHVLNLVASRLSRGYGNVTQPITNFLSRSEMDLNTNFSNLMTIPGNIAGAVGSSAAGPDYRKITWGQVSFDITRLPFGKKLVDIEVVLGFEVKDAIDFCPDGGCGAMLEQLLATIKMSRLEASGEAYDLPFIVRFTGPTRHKRVID